MQNTDKDDVLLPPWASGMAHGDYLMVGAMLPTRDGRRMGNAVVVSAEWKGVSIAHIKTDAGTDVTLTERELTEQFWPPTWVRKTVSNPARSTGGQDEAVLSIADSLKRLADHLAPADAAINGNFLERLEGVLYGVLNHYRRG